MARKKQMIVLVHEDVDTKDFAAHATKADEDQVVDALTKMQTNFQPTEDTIQANPDGSFFVANLSSREAEQLKKSKEVIDVVEDEPVYAFADEQQVIEQEQLKAGLRNGDSIHYETFERFDLNPRDTIGQTEQEAIESETMPFWEGEEDPRKPSAEELSRLCTISQNGNIDYEMDLRLDDELHGIEPMQPAFDRVEKKELTDEQIGRAVRQITEKVLRETGQPITEEKVDAVLKTVDLQQLIYYPFFDLILPNIRMVNAPPAWRFTKGARARIAVVDTGIDPRHRDLRVVGGVSYVPGVTSWRDDHAHGTHCAGIIGALMNRQGVVGVAPRAEVFAVKVLNRNGSGQLSWVLNGLLWCARFGMHVVNLSLGSAFNSHDPRQYNTAYEHVGRILRRRGVLCVAAAGNDRHRPVGNPARCPSYMAVSAIDFDRRLTTFTNIGPQVEICAPGLQILSTVPGGYRRMSGTSMATPHVAGAAALVKSRYPALHGDSIRLRLMRTATDLGYPGRDWAFGYGLVNAYRAL